MLSVLYHFNAHSHLRFNFFNFGALTNFLHYITVLDKMETTSKEKQSAEVVSKSRIN